MYLFFCWPDVSSVTFKNANYAQHCPQDLIVVREELSYLVKTLPLVSMYHSGQSLVSSRWMVALMQKMGKRKEKRKPGILLFNMHVYLIWKSTPNYHNYGIFIYSILSIIFLIHCHMFQSCWGEISWEWYCDADNRRQTGKRRGPEETRGIWEYFLIVGPPPPLFVTPVPQKKMWVSLHLRSLGVLS